MNFLRISFLTCLIAVTASHLAAEVIELTSVKELEQLILNNPFVVVKFSAKWCGPCRQFAPIFNKIASELKDTVVFVTVDFDNSPGLVKEYSVEGVPLRIYIKNGKIEKKQGGGLSAKAFSSSVKDIFNIK